MRNGGTAHKNMEASKSMDGGDARRWHFSHQSLEVPSPQSPVPSPWSPVTFNPYFLTFFLSLAHHIPEISEADDAVFRAKSSIDGIDFDDGGAAHKNQKRREV